MRPTTIGHRVECDAGSGFDPAPASVSAGVQNFHSHMNFLSALSNHIKRAIGKSGGAATNKRAETTPDALDVRWRLGRHDHTYLMAPVMPLQSASDDVDMLRESDPHMSKAMETAGKLAAASALIADAQGRQEKEVYRLGLKHFWSPP